MKTTCQLRGVHPDAGSAGVDSVAIVLAHARSKVEGCFLQACTGDYAYSLTDA